MLLLSGAVCLRQWMISTFRRNKMIMARELGRREVESDLHVVSVGIWDFKVTLLLISI